MAIRQETSGPPQQVRKPRDGRAPSRVIPRARARAPATRTDAEVAQLELLKRAQQVWLTGVEALSRVQKDGPLAFQEAFLEGLRLLHRSRLITREIVRDAFENAQDTLQEKVGSARGQAQGTLDSIEALFQRRVERTLQQLGMPTATEYRALQERVDELNQRVRELHERLKAKERVSQPKTSPRRGYQPRSGASAASRPARSRGPV